MKAGRRAAAGGDFGLCPGLVSCRLLGTARDPQGHILGTQNVMVLDRRGTVRMCMASRASKGPGGRAGGGGGHCSPK